MSLEVFSMCSRSFIRYPLAIMRSHYKCPPAAKVNFTWVSTERVYCVDGSAMSESKVKDRLSYAMADWYLSNWQGDWCFTYRCPKCDYRIKEIYSNQETLVPDATLRRRCDS